MKAGIGVALAAAMLAASCMTITVTDDAKPKPPAAVSANLRGISSEVSETRLRGYIEKMVSFGTRSTISDQTSPTRGIGAARKWVENEFRSIGAACGGCLEYATPSDTVTGNRYPQPTLVVDVVAIQRGTTDSNRVIIIQGHLDSRNSTNENVTDDAPGANDDASGVAAVIEFGSYSLKAEIRRHHRLCSALRGRAGAFGRNNSCCLRQGAGLAGGSRAE
ncbi:MAG: M28 family peptidase [Hyphomonadaceae bacterium]